MEVADSLTENILRYFPAVKRFIDDALAAGGKILLHGNAGISRRFGWPMAAVAIGWGSPPPGPLPWYSGTLLIAYIMNTHALDYSQALRVVQARRFCVNPNESFAVRLLLCLMWRGNGAHPPPAYECFRLRRAEPADRVRAHLPRAAHDVTYTGPGAARHGSVARVLVCVCVSVGPGRPAHSWSAGPADRRKRG